MAKRKAEVLQNSGRSNLWRPHKEGSLSARSNLNHTPATPAQRNSVYSSSKTLVSKQILDQSKPNPPAEASRCSTTKKLSDTGAATDRHREFIRSIDRYRSPSNDRHGNRRPSARGQSPRGQQPGGQSVRRHSTTSASKLATSSSANDSLPSVAQSNGCVVAALIPPTDKVPATPPRLVTIKATNLFTPTSLMVRRPNTKSSTKAVSKSIKSASSHVSGTSIPIIHSAPATGPAACTPAAAASIAVPAATRVPKATAVGQSNSTEFTMRDNINDFTNLPSSCSKPLHDGKHEDKHEVVAIMTRLVVPVIDFTALKKSQPTFVGPNAISLLYPLSLNQSADVEQALIGLFGLWGSTGDVLSETDRKANSSSQVSFIYGEVLPDGVRRLLDKEHLAAGGARTLVDLGSGKTRLALQAFLDHPNLESIVAIEFSPSRFECARKALRALAQANPKFMHFAESSIEAVLTHLTRSGKRTLTLRCQDLFLCTETFHADIVVCETHFPESRLAELVSLLSRLKDGARFVLYHGLAELPGIRLSADKVYVYPPVTLTDADKPIVFKRIAPGEGYATSWHSSCRFDLWERLHWDKCKNCKTRILSNEFPKHKKTCTSHPSSF